MQYHLNANQTQHAFFASFHQKNNERENDLPHFLYKSPVN